MSTNQRGRPLSNGMFRNYCCVCEAPIEVAECRRFKTKMCCDTHAKRRPSSNVGGWCSPSATDENPWQSNVIREFEDCRTGEA